MATMASLSFASVRGALTRRGGFAARTSSAVRPYARGVVSASGAPDVPADAYLVTYCHEFNAAKAAILSVHADAEVVPHRIDSYPITVTVTKNDEVVWSGRQQGLFGKNGRPAQAEIIAALQKMASSE